MTIQNSAISDFSLAHQKLTNITATANSRKAPASNSRFATQISTLIKGLNNSK